MLKVILGGLIGAFLGAIGIVIVAAIVFGFSGILSGGYDGFISGISGALYYGIGFALYFGLAPGAIIGAVWAYRSTSRTVQNTSKAIVNKKETGKTKFLGIGLAFLIVIAFASIPYVFTGVTKELTYQVSWTHGSREDFSGCSNPIVLMLVEYPNYEVVCSSEIAEYLQSDDSELTTITYRVTYDFGKVRSYQLVRVNHFQVDWSEWESGSSGCGGKYLPACDSAENYNRSPFHK